MTFDEAMAQGPAWLQIWLNWLLVGAFILPLALLFWRQSRIIGVATVGLSVLAAIGVVQMYNHIGYVKLLGLPHIIAWTPLLVYQARLFRSATLPRPARAILLVIMATLLVSLVFDYADVARYALGERTSLALPPQ